MKTPRHGMSLLGCVVGMGRMIAVGVAAVAMLVPSQVRSEALNDGAAAAVGGIRNYFDWINTFSNVAAILGTDGTSFCSGTLINSRTVLTAAHCFFDKSNARDGEPGQSVSFLPVATNNSRTDPNTRQITSNIVHSGYVSGSKTTSANDIALVSLAAPISASTLKPVSLAASSASAASLVGTQIVSVGYGSIGTGSQCCDATDNKRRAVTSTLGTYAAEVNLTDNGVLASPNVCSGDVDKCVQKQSNQNFFVAQFQNPNNLADPNYFGLRASTTPGYYNREGGPTKGDSGGPLFVQLNDGSLVQLGELCCGSNPTGGVSSGYGEVNLWTPIPDFATWIAQNNPLRTVSARGGTVAWSDPTTWVDSVAGVAGAVPNNTVGNVADFATDAARYYDVSLSNAGTVNLDMTATIDTLSISGPRSELVLLAGNTLSTELSSSLSAGTMTFAGGTLVSPELGITGGLLTGFGRITAAGGTTGVCNSGVCNTGGTVAPRGTLTIQGNYAQGAGGTLSVTTGSDRTDLLAVSDTASLGGALQVLLLPQSAPVTSGTTSTIVSAGTLAGAFTSGGTSQLSPFISASTDYTATAAQITLTRNASYASLATTEDERAFASRLDTGLATNDLTTDMKGILARLDVAPNADAARQFYDQADADGEGSDVVGNQLLASMASARLVGGVIDRHLSALRDDTAPLLQRAAGLRGLSVAYGTAAGFGLSSRFDAQPDYIAAAATPTGPAFDAPMNGWVQGVGAWQRLRSDGNAIGLKQNLGGVVAGFDVNPFAAVAPSLKSGVAFSYMHGDLGGGSETGATDSYRGVIYATQDFGPAYLDGRLGFGVTQMTTTRQITALGLSRTAFGNTSGSDWAAAINAGYRCIEGPYLLEPSLGLAWNRVGRDSYTETNAGALNLSISEGSLDSLQLSAGMRARADFDLGDGTLVRPEVRARYVYDALNPIPTTTATLAGIPGLPFTVEGVNTGHNAAMLGAGVTLTHGGSLALFVDYNAELRNHETVHAVVGGLRVVW